MVRTNECCGMDCFRMDVTWTVWPQQPRPDCRYGPPARRSTATPTRRQRMPASLSPSAPPALSPRSADETGAMGGRDSPAAPVASFRGLDPGPEAVNAAAASTQQPAPEPPSRKQQPQETLLTVLPTPHSSTEPALGAQVAKGATSATAADAAAGAARAAGPGGAAAAGINDPDTAVAAAAAPQPSAAPPRQPAPEAAPAAAQRPTFDLAYAENLRERLLASSRQGYRATADALPAAEALALLEAGCQAFKSEPCMLEVCAWTRARGKGEAERQPDSCEHATRKAALQIFGQKDTG
eukprot:364577-Chlamydomonas_euryale.AAC.18